MLVDAGLNDPRVGYREPAKWVARLRAMRTDDHVLVLKTHMGWALLALSAASTGGGNRPRYTPSWWTKLAPERRLACKRGGRRARESVRR